MKHKNKVDFIIPDRYLNYVLYSMEDAPMIGTIKYLRDQGKDCRLLGFNSNNFYVVLIDGIKYYGSVRCNPEELNVATFYVVDDVEYDYKNRNHDRTMQLLKLLGDQNE